MTENVENQEEQTTNNDIQNNVPASNPVDEMDTKIQEALKPIKEKLDKAYAERDTALKKAAEYEQKEKEAELKRLQEEGKHKEAYELQLAEANAKLDAITKRNIELSRDLEIKSILSGYTFRSDKAADMAYMDVASQLVQSDNGVWVHKSGTDLRTFIKQFSEDENNSFLFKPKVSTGAGQTSSSGTSQSSSNKSIFELSQDEVLKRAAEGNLRRN